MQSWVLLLRSLLIIQDSVLIKMFTTVIKNKMVIVPLHLFLFNSTTCNKISCIWLGFGEQIAFCTRISWFNFDCDPDLGFQPFSFLFSFFKPKLQCIHTLSPNGLTSRRPQWAAYHHLVCQKIKPGRQMINKYKLRRMLQLGGTVGLWVMIVLYWVPFCDLVYVLSLTDLVEPWCT